MAIQRIGEEAAQAIIQAQPVTIPSQPDVTPRFAQYWDTDEIVEDLQTATITERYLVGGNPLEAKVSSVLSGKQLGQPHASLDDYYMARRRFKRYTEGSVETERITMVEFTYQKMPCPREWRVSFTTVLKSMREWFDYGEPATNLEAGPAGISVLRPIIVATIRKVIDSTTTLAQIMAMGENVGTRNNATFMEKSIGFWMFEDMRFNQLFGSVGSPFDNSQTPNSSWEAVLVFKGDPWRRHERWFVQFEENTLEQIQKPPTLNDFDTRRRSHQVQDTVPIRFDFLDIVGGDLEGCIVPSL